MAKAYRIGRLSETGALPCLARRAGPGVGGVGEVGPDTQLCHESQAPKGRVRATLRRASKRWTSSSRSAQVARGRGVLGPREPACPVGDAPGFVSTGSARDRESAAYSGVAGETHWIDLSVTSPSGADSLNRESVIGGTIRNRCPAPPGLLEVQGALDERKLTQLSAADHSARESMKDAAKCVN